MKVYLARIMFIGQARAGKTSLKKSLLGMPFDPEEQSTVGIEVDPSSFKVDVDQVKNWQRTEEKLGMSQFAQELARMAAGELDKEEAKVDLKAHYVPMERSQTNQVGNKTLSANEVKTSLAYLKGLSKLRRVVFLFCDIFFRSRDIHVLVSYAN